MATLIMGSVSHGTMRPQDLIPTFLGVLNQVDPVTYSQLAVLPFSVVPSYAQEDEDSEWWGGEDCMNVLEDLITALDNAAPEGYYFGPHPGDGSDYGFWEVEQHDAPEQNSFTELTDLWRKHKYREARTVLLGMTVSDVQEFLEYVSTPTTGLAKGPGEAQAIGVWVWSIIVQRVKPGGL